MTSNYTRASLYCAALLVVCGAMIQRAQAWGYYVDECTDFNQGHGCQSSDLNTVTESLASRLTTDGHLGKRYMNRDAWPQDFEESCSSIYNENGPYEAIGDDDVYADTQLLSVYAGHGNVGKLLFSWKRATICHIWLERNGALGNIRLGSMGGNQSGYAMYITSCTLRTTEVQYTANSEWLRQQFGYHNSPTVPDDAPKDFYYATRGNDPETGFPISFPNGQTWLDFMEIDQDGDEDNSPVVVSQGSSKTNAIDVRDTASLRGGVFTSKRGGGPACGAGQPGFFYNVLVRDHGSSQGCKW